MRSPASVVEPAPATTTPAALPAPPVHTRRRRSGGHLLLTAVTWLLALFFAGPGLWMLLTSFHSEADAATNPPSLLAPLTLSGYGEFFGANSGISPVRPLVNSLIASVGSTVMVLVLALPAAYALSIKSIVKWRDVLFFFLSTKMMPIVAALLPLYLLANYIGGLDKIWFLLIVYMVMNLPIAVWMLRSFLADVPVEMIEAAEIDGASLMTTLRRVLLPVILPGMAATSLICFIFSWNELLVARVLTGVSAQTAPVFLTGFVSSQGLFLAKVCAASMVISIPVLIAGLTAQDKFVQGLTLGAVK